MASGIFLEHSCLQSSGKLYQKAVRCFEYEGYLAGLLKIQCSEGYICFLYINQMSVRNKKCHVDKIKATVLR